MLNIIRRNYINILLYLFFINMLYLYIALDKFTYYSLKEDAKTYKNYVDSNKLSHFIMCIKKKESELEKKATHLYLNVYYVYPNNIIIKDKEKNIISIFKISDLIEKYWDYFLLFDMIALFLYLLPFIRAIKREKESIFLSKLSSEATLTNNIMVDLTENIHHEISTPLEVIDNKTYKIYSTIQNLIKEELKEIGKYEELPPNKRKRCDKIRSLDKDFQYIKDSSDQIYSIMQKMKGYKNLRYSNGNKTIYDIIHGALEFTKLKNSIFLYYIDPSFKKYKLNHKNISNADLLSSLINHFKNSVEAYANNIEVILGKVDKSYIEILIKDNGKGIKNNNLNEVFRYNFSTKTKKDIVRGSGMYLSKKIIESAGGKVIIKNTSSRGTTISLTIPYE